MSGSVARAASRNWRSATRFSSESANGQRELPPSLSLSLSFLGFAFCSSAQRSLMAPTEPRRATAGLMHRRWRDDSGICRMGSAVDFSVLAGSPNSGRDDGNDGRRSSAMNCVSCEWVRDV